jgi:hypothetical protein
VCSPKEKDVTRAGGVVKTDKSEGMKVDKVRKREKERIIGRGEERNRDKRIRGREDERKREGTSICRP